MYKIITLLLVILIILPVSVYGYNSKSEYKVGNANINVQNMKTNMNEKNEYKLKQVKTSEQNDSHEVNNRKVRYKKLTNAMFIILGIIILVTIVVKRYIYKNKYI